MGYYFVLKNLPIKLKRIIVKKKLFFDKAFVPNIYFQQIQIIFMGPAKKVFGHRSLRRTLVHSDHD